MYSVSDDRPDEPRITEEAFFRGNILFSGDIEMGILHEPLKEYGILDETSFHVLRSVRRYRRRLFFLDRIHYLMYILGKNDNGLQILYRCLKETQHRFPAHRRIVQRKGERNPVQHILTCKEQSVSALTRSYYSYIHDLARLGELSTLPRWIRAHFRGLPSVALP